MILGKYIKTVSHTVSLTFSVSRQNKLSLKLIQISCLHWWKSFPNITKMCYQEIRQIKAKYFRYYENIFWKERSVFLLYSSIYKLLILFTILIYSIFMFKKFVSVVLKPLKWEQNEHVCRLFFLSSLVLRLYAHTYTRTRVAYNFITIFNLPHTMYMCVCLLRDTELISVWIFRARSRLGFVKNLSSLTRYTSCG